MGAAFLGVQKAFDKVYHITLFLKLIEPGTLYDYLNKILILVEKGGT